MDYHSLPRKQLQALCKKHGIPANATNSEMADALTTLLKPKPLQKLEKRATRNHGPALTETVSMSNDVEEGSNTKLQKATESHKIPEEDSNKKLQRVTRGRGSASAVSEAPESAASKTAKVPTDCQGESNSAAKQQGTKKVSTRNGAIKQNNGEMPPHAEGNVDLKAMSPSDKKKEKVGGIVLRRGRVKVRSPRSLSKSPESAQVTKEVVVTTKEKGVGRPCSQSCLVDARRTRKKKRSVTFSDVIEINSASIEHAPEGCVPENDKEPVKDTVVDIQQDMDSSLLKNVNPASVAKKAIGTRRTSRSVLTHTIAAQADHQKISKEPVAKVSKTISSEKTVSLESGRESDIKREIRSKKASNSAGDAAAKENATKEFGKEKVTDGFVKGDLNEAAPCTRRSRRLTIIPTDVKFNHNPELATEQLKGPKHQNEDISTAPKETEGDLPAAETSRRSRRKTLAPLELNHVQSAVKSASEQVEKKVSKSDKQPSKPKDVSSVKNLCGSRQKSLVTSTDQHITSADEILTEMEITSILVNYEPDSLQEVSIGAKEEAKATKTSVVPRSTRKASKVSTQPDYETTILQEPACGTQINSVEHEGLVIVDEVVAKIIQNSEDFDVIAPACNEQYLADLVLENTNLLRVEVPVCSTPSNEDMNASDRFLCASHAAIDEEGEGLNPISRDDTCSVDIRSSSTKAIHCAAGDSETANASPLVDTESIEPDDAAAVQDQIASVTSAEPSRHEFSVEKDQVVEQEGNAMDETVDTESIEPDDAAAVQDQIVSVTSPEPSRHEFSVEKDQVVEQEGNAMDETVATISSAKDMKDELRIISPVSKMISEYDSLDGTCHMDGIDLENSIENYTDKDTVASSPAANMESTIDISVDVAAANQEACTSNVHILSSDNDKVALTSGEAVASIEQQLNQAVDLNLCEEDDTVHEVEMKVQVDLQEEQPQDTNEAAPCDGVKSIDNSTANDQLQQLSPLSPSCSVEPGTVLLRESACKTKQWHPRAIYKSARKAQISMPWENTNLEENTALDAEIWGLNNHEMSSDEVDSASSEDEGSSAETEESLSETETSNFKTEMLISNTEERDYSPSEDDTPSDSEKDTMFDSEDYFSDMEEEEDLLSGEESYESEEQESSEEELSESEDDAEADFEEYEASPVSKSMATSESVDGLYITHGIENKVEIMAAPESSLPSDGDVQLEIINLLALENDNECCAPDGQPTDVDEKVGAQLETLQKATLMHAVSEIQEDVDVLTNSNDNPATDYTFQDLLSSPPSKVKEDVMCLLAPLGISETDVSLQCGTLETELNILPESMQEKSTQLCFPSELSCKEVLAEAEQHTMDEAKHETGLCESVGGVENILEINSQMSELVQECCVEEMTQPLSKPMVTEIQKNVDVLMSCNDNTGMEQMQCTTGSTYQDNDLLDSLSSLFASPLLKVQESSLAPPLIGILESNVSQQSGTLETELNILPKSGHAESMLLCSPCELSQNNVIAEVEQHILDGAEDEADLCGSEGGIEKELEVEDQMVEPIQVENCHAGPAAADHVMASPMTDDREDSQILESKSSNAFTGSKESELIHSTASELPCLSPCEFFVENIGAEMANPVPCEEVIQNSINAQEVQEEPGNLEMNEVVSSGVEEDEARNLEIKNELENNEGSVDMAPDTQNGSEELMELLELGEGTTALLIEEFQVIKDAAFGDSPLAVYYKPSEKETAALQDLQSFVLGNSYSIDDLPQKQNNEDALVFDAAYITEGTTGSVVSVECAEDLELGIGADDDKIHLFASGTSGDLLEEAEPLVQHECQQDILPVDGSQEQETKVIGKEPEVLQSESNVGSLASQVVASNIFEVEQCNTPKQSTDSETASVFIHESLNEVAQIVDIASLNSQVEDIHKKPLDEIQTSEESKEDVEKAVAHDLVPEITKEQAMKQIDLTLLSVRQLRQMCKGNLMSAKKKTDKEIKQKTENETPAKTPSRLWMSATKQVHQPNTSMQPRDVPSANKRSALKALSSNIKATPSAAMQTPTAKGSNRPLNLMSTYDGNDGIGKHLVTPSPQAPMSSKRDFARSHHR